MNEADVIQICCRKKMKNRDDLYTRAINVIYRLIMNVAKEWTTNDAFKLSKSSYSKLPDLTKPLKYEKPIEQGLGKTTIDEYRTNRSGVKAS